MSRFGLPDEVARLYESHFRRGRALIVVRSEARYGLAYDILTHRGAAPLPKPAAADQHLRN